MKMFHVLTFLRKYSLDNRTIQLFRPSPIRDNDTSHVCSRPPNLTSQTIGTMTCQDFLSGSHVSINRHRQSIGEQTSRINGPTLLPGGVDTISSNIENKKHFVADVSTTCLILKKSFIEEEEEESLCRVLSRLFCFEAERRENRVSDRSIRGFKATFTISQTLENPNWGQTVVRDFVNCVLIMLGDLIMDLSNTSISDEFLGTFAPILVYWVYSGIYIMLDSLDNYRLHSRKEEDIKNLVSKKTVVKGVLLQQSIQAFIAIILFTVTGSDSDPTADVQKFSPFYLFVLARQFVVAMAVLDTWQYFMHRYMHHNKFLYRHIHSQHHRLVVPYAFGALYNHPVEGLLLDTIGGALAFLLSGMSPRVSIFFFSFATIKTVDDHCGLWLPGNLFHLFFNNNTAYHDVHHQLYGSKYNFSQPFFVMWDRLLGTYMPYSLEERVGGGFEARPTRDCKAD